MKVVITVLVVSFILSSGSAFASSNIILTAKEKAYISSHPVITATNEQKWSPFNFFEDGQPKGFSTDFLNLLADRVGLKVDYISGPTWSEFVEMMKRGEVDVLLNVAFQKKRTAWLDYLDRPYAEVLYGMVVSQDRTDIREFNDILTKKIVIEDGFWIHNWLNEHYPDLKLLLVKNSQDALQAVALNQADVFIGNVSVGGYLIKKHLLTNLKLISLGETTLEKSNALYLGVTKGNVLLKSILDKAMADVSGVETNQLAEKWTLQQLSASSVIRSENARRAGPEFSTQEKSFIANTVIRSATTTNWAPFSFVMMVPVKRVVSGCLFGNKL